MTQDNAEGNAVAERIRAADISVNGSSSVEAMLANSLKERKPLADDGKLHDTIQEAENAASAFVFVPPGTFKESVTIDTAGLTLMGSGNGSLVDGGSNITIDITANNVSISDLKVRNKGTSNNFSVINCSGVNNISIENIFIPHANQSGVEFSNVSDSTISKVTVKESANKPVAIYDGSQNIIVSNVVVDTVGEYDFSTGINCQEVNDIVISNCIVNGTDADGIKLRDTNDSIVIGCRVSNVSRNGIHIQSVNITPSDNIISNNRISDSGGSNIDDQGTNTTLDSNLTGTAN